jgi:hypothetical protein
MKHIQTFESFLNENFEELELNEAAKLKKVSLPAKHSTVTNKILKTNPWKFGKEIADMVEQNWNDIINTAKNVQYQHQLVDELKKKDYIIEMAEKHSLDVGHFVQTGIANYF